MISIVTIMYRNNFTLDIYLPGMTGEIAFYSCLLHQSLHERLELMDPQSGFGVLQLSDVCAGQGPPVQPAFEPQSFQVHGHDADVTPGVLPLGVLTDVLELHSAAGLQTALVVFTNFSIISHKVTGSVRAQGELVTSQVVMFVEIGRAHV